MQPFTAGESIVMHEAVYPVRNTVECVRGSAGLGDARRNARGRGAVLVTNRLPPWQGDLQGRKIAGYVIDSHVGDGGMGSVYGATSQLIEGRRAAVKVMAIENTHDPDLVARFLREAAVAAAVDDPNIIDFWGADRFDEDGRLYILMPLVAGESLESLCRRRGPLPVDVAATIILQVASGLASVHAVPIVHRDIKTSNILLSRRRGLRNHVTILDFGIAKLLDDNNPSPRGRTRTHMTLGTIGSMAPEQAGHAKTVDARADIYSVGVVLYRMLTGRAPYEGEDVFEVMKKQLGNEPFPRLRSLRPDVPPAWEEVVHAMMQLEVEDRPRSLREVAKAIAGALPQGGALLQYLAPKFTSDRPLLPTEATLSGDLEDLLFRLDAVKTSPPRRRALAPIALAMASGLAVGGLSVALAMRGQHVSEVREPSSAPVSSATTILPVIASDAMIATAEATWMDASVPDASLGSATIIQPDAAIAVVAPRPIPPQPAHASPLPARAVQSEQQPGIVIVNVKPYAEVYIDDVSAGTTPVRQSTRAGTHHLRLVGANKTEELDVTITAGKPTTVVRSW